MDDDGLVEVLVIEPGVTHATRRRVGRDPQTWQDLVGGWLEVLTLDPGTVAVVNEDGRMLRLPGNPAATRLVDLAAPGMLRPGDPLLGPVVLSGLDGGGFSDVPETVRALCEQAGVAVRDGG